MENLEKINPIEVSFDELQAFFNSPDLVIPQTRRDLSDPKNIRWLIRNIGIQNKNLPHKYLDALAEFAGNDQFSKNLIETWKQNL